MNSLKGISELIEKQQKISMNKQEGMEVKRRKGQEPEQSYEKKKRSNSIYSWDENLLKASSSRDRRRSSTSSMQTLRRILELEDRMKENEKVN